MPTIQLPVNTAEFITCAGFIASAVIAVFLLTRVLRLIFRIFHRPLRIADTDAWRALSAAERGRNFEIWCAEWLRRNGFRAVRILGGSGDQGADIECWKGIRRYVVQCKCYTRKLDNTSVQEVHAAIKFFGNPIIEMEQAVVMTNSYFTKGAKKAAEKCHVLLWDRETLRKGCR